MPRELTQRQQEIYNFIARAIRKKGYPPTIREIMDQFEIASTNGVRTTLAALEKKGHIKRRPMLSRGIELTEQVERDVPNVSTADVRQVPVLGRVAAGQPILAIENADETVAVDASFLSSGDVFALLVEGDSMVNVGILDGDYVLARHQTTANQGEIIVAIIDGEATVKRYYVDGDGVQLIAENESYSPIVVEPDQEFRIAGKIVSLMRRF
ncbi:MAG: repressor LexA [Gemmatimonadetes bacterium]|jgi:repressor LexA|nr:repressor LexA [Gemmatimonadota bacterium]